jgi:hypothetical protein
MQQKRVAGCLRCNWPFVAVIVVWYWWSDLILLLWISTVICDRDDWLFCRVQGTFSSESWDWTLNEFWQTFDRVLTNPLWHKKTTPKNTWELNSTEDWKQVGNQPRRFVFSISIIPTALISYVIEFLIIVVDVMKIIKCFGSRDLFKAEVK